MIDTRPRTRRSRTVALLAAGALVAGGVSAVPLPSQAKSATTPYGNLAEALQKSLYFYDAEKSGAARTLGHQPLEWRGDSEPDRREGSARDPRRSSRTGRAPTSPRRSSSANKAILDPDGDGTIDLSGGFHDAGDHVKFGLPQSYAAGTIGWGMYEFPDAFKATGTWDHAHGGDALVHRLLPALDVPATNPERSSPSTTRSATAPSTTPTGARPSCRSPSSTHRPAVLRYLGDAGQRPDRQARRGAGDHGI